MIQYSHRDPYGRRPGRRIPVRRPGFAEKYGLADESRQTGSTFAASDHSVTPKRDTQYDEPQRHHPEPEPTENQHDTARETISQPETDWQKVAAQLQADMGNFRKRQQRQAEESAGKERERVLKLFLPVLDNLSRALNHNQTEDNSLRQGVELTYRELLRLMQAEGVARVEAVGQPFDPSYHEALAIISSDAETDTVVEEVEAGYTLDERLLRPAKVIVAA